MKDNVVKSASGAVNYILSNLDSSGQERAVKPEIIYGNPDLIKSYDNHPKMGTKNKSTSGVISLRDGEQLTKEQEELLVQRFQELIIPEQFRDVVDMFLVKHQDKGNTEYHFVIPHLTLEGKKFNPFPVIGRDNGLSSFASTQAATRILNDEFGFDQVQPNPEGRKGLNNREIKASKYSPNEALKKDIKNKKLIAEFYIRQVKSGNITNKPELIDKLKSDGFSITRNGENYISIKHEKWNKAIRLEGGIFANNSEKAYATLQEQANKSDGTTKQSQEIEPYTAEHKARDEQLVKAFHALVVDKYEGKRANMNSLFQEFKQIQNQEIKPVNEPKPEGPTTAQIEQPAPVAPTDKPKAHTAPIQAPQPTSPGNPPGQQDQPPAIAGSQGLGGVVVASGEGEAHAAVNAASSDVAAAERDYGINSQQAKNAKANLSKAIQQLQQILARIWKKDAMERKQAQVQGSIAQAPVGPVGLIGPIGPFLGSIKDKISGIKKAPFENIQKKKSKYNI